MAIRGRVANPLGRKMREFESHLLRHFKLDFIINRGYAWVAQSGKSAGLKNQTSSVRFGPQAPLL